MPRPATALLTTLGAILLTGLGGMIGVGLYNGNSPLHLAVISWMAVSYTVCGLVAWSARPGIRFGPLMVATGVAILITTLIWFEQGIPHSIGQYLDLLPFVLVVHVFLSYPSGRIRRPLERILLGIGYAAALVSQLVVMLLGGLTPQVFTVLDRPGLALVIFKVELVVVSAVALGAAALLLTRRRRQRRPLRRSFRLLLDSFTVGLVMIAALLLSGALGGPVFPVVQQVSLFLLGVAPVAFVAGLLQIRLARSSIGDLVMELREDPADLRTPLSRALRDPSLELLYWLPRFEVWADEGGQPVPLPDDPQRMTVIMEDGEPMAALVHDPALRDEQELLNAVTAAAAIALRNGRLQAQLRATVDELQGSRARVLEAGQRERQRLERDLHDGAQQRLVALSLSLGVLQTRLDGDPGAADLLSAARTEIATSLDELRDLARGLHPAVVTAHGLAVALESLAARAPVPVSLKVDVPEKGEEAIEVAAYYVVCESLTNIGKHADARSATVEVVEREGKLVIEVADDGRGGADAERGSGLRGLADRVEALGGRLRVWTPVGGGTLVRAELPCG
ncbi:histidine kinase [Actinoplanes sp. NPDC051633]|uniref:sensor histidine kinase n=1 Tax=Actinoplanes sp. NPDC051633 TaxID=3155670 RepID=UPI00342B5234